MAGAIVSSDLTYIDAPSRARDMETSGYRLESELDFLPFQSFLLFRGE